MRATTQYGLTQALTYISSAIRMGGVNEKDAETLKTIEKQLVEMLQKENTDA